MSDWETNRKPALMARLLSLPRYEKINMIRKAKSYRSGTDSCNSVYMGSMATSQLLHSLGGSYGKDDLDQLLTQANDAQLNKALDICASYIETMEKHPTEPCPCCGQIVAASSVPGTGIENLLKKAVAAFNALSPEQQAEMLEEQRQSWVRGNVGLSRDERGMTSPVMPRPVPADLKARDRKRYKLIRKSLQNKGLLPAATDTGLETVLIQKRCTEPVDGYWGNSYLPVDKPFDATWTDPESGRQYEHRALVTHSQAEKLLAAKDAEIAKLSDLVENWSDMAINMEKHIDKLKADNAAKEDFKRQAREHFDAFCAMRNDINELIGNMPSLEGIMLEAGPENAPQYQAVVEAVKLALEAKGERVREEIAVSSSLLTTMTALKAKLAAAEKALEEADEALQADAIASAHAAIRAVLGGKP